MPEASGNPGSERRKRWLLRASIVAIAIAAALAAWLATRDSGGNAPVAETHSRIVSPAELAEASAVLGQPIFWAGTLPATEMKLYELAEGGGAQVAYMPEGSGAEEPSAGVLTIGSYPLADPTAAVRKIASGKGALVRHSRDGREVVTTRDQPTSVYFADPKGGVQVEVYDPSPKRAMTVARSGRVAPVR